MLWDLLCNFSYSTSSIILNISLQVEPKHVKEAFRLLNKSIIRVETPDIQFDEQENEGSLPFNPSLYQQYHIVSCSYCHAQRHCCGGGIWWMGGFFVLICTALLVGRYIWRSHKKFELKLHAFVIIASSIVCLIIVMKFAIFALCAIYIKYQAQIIVRDFS